MELTDRDIIRIQFENIICLEFFEKYADKKLVFDEEFITTRAIEMTLCAKKQGFDVWNRKRCLKNSNGEEK